MRIMIATDAWFPQMNGVVRTLTSLTKSLQCLGVEVELLTPEGFPSIPIPGYSDIRLAIPSLREISRRIHQAKPDAIHVTTEGPIGWMVRRFCMLNGRPFTTSFTTRFPEYVGARLPIPVSLSYAVLRRFHAAGKITMAATHYLMSDLEKHGFRNLGLWSRGVDTDLFRPDRATDLRFLRPVFVSVGRLAVEKNVEAFLSLDLPGTKVVIGTGPQEADLRRRFPDARFLGELRGPSLAAHVAASDVFVFPSKTDTFGNVQLEALACGIPVAAFPVPGPLDVIGSNPVGVLRDDLREACLEALHISRDACRKFALTRTWEVSARQFLGHAQRIAPAACIETPSMAPTRTATMA
jgi:glycosyltransferase involved in cell wall biosynthesis